jgi:hypothetical protein
LMSGAIRAATNGRAALRRNIPLPGGVKIA